MATRMTWSAETPPVNLNFGFAGWARVLIKGILIGGVTFGCLALLLLLRMVERPIFGAHRPWTPHITQFVCRTALRLFGITRHRSGRPMTDPGALVANHVSWLDIFVLNAETRIYFVAKSEVRGWPGIGWLARATGTVFIDRDPTKARKQVEEIGHRLKAGHQLLFFPEGTSTDGRRVLDFRSTLFQPFAVQTAEPVQIQPVSVIYRAPDGEDDRFYGWWGDMDFGSSLLKMLAAPRHGHVELRYHPAINSAEAGGRKALAAEAGRTVREALEAALARDKGV